MFGGCCKLPFCKNSDILVSAFPGYLLGNAFTRMSEILFVYYSIEYLENGVHLDPTRGRQHADEERIHAARVQNCLMLKREAQHRLSNPVRPGLDGRVR